MEKYQSRMILEYFQLNKRKTDLEKFIRDQESGKSKIKLKYPLSIMKNQLYGMKTYERSLVSRMKHEGIVTGTIVPAIKAGDLEFGFDTAIRVMKIGYSVRRKEWDEEYEGLTLFYDENESSIHEAYFGKDRGTFYDLYGADFFADDWQIAGSLKNDQKE